MREIRFRAWEKFLKQMIPVDNIDFEQKMINTESAWRMFDEIEIMQYTGLKDKNGKEIYEGDILRDEHTQKIRAVEYNSPSFVLVDSNRYFFWNCHYDEQEVIGNIYENPELMEV